MATKKKTQKKATSRTVAKKKAVRKPAGAKKRAGKKKAPVRRAARPPVKPKIAIQVTQKSILQDQLKLITKKIDQVKIESRNALNKTKKRYEKLLKDLEKQRKVVEKRLRSLLAKGDLAWNDFRTYVSKAVAEVDRAVKSALAEFRK